MRTNVFSSTLCTAALLLACGGGSTNNPDAGTNGTSTGWAKVHQNLSGALLSVWGTSATDVWVVGGDARDGRGPIVLRFDGSGWKRLPTGAEGDLWWVFGFANGPVYLGGAGGVILRYQNGAFERMTTPGTGTVFGIWGLSADDVWAVGGNTGGSNGAFAWRLQGGQWVEAPGFPEALEATDSLWKVFGRSANDAWLVGTNGKVLHWTGSFSQPENAGGGESLFTVHANSQRYVAVGGFATANILENDGSGWRNAAPAGAPGVIGVAVTETDGYAVGNEGAVFRRGASGWAEEEKGFFLNESLHAVWLDPSGGVWAVGGEVASTPLVSGVLVHKGQPISTEIEGL